MASEWADVSWEALERLRRGFLEGGRELARDYWRSAADLRSFAMSIVPAICR